MPRAPTSSAIPTIVAPPPARAPPPPPPARAPPPPPKPAPKYSLRTRPPPKPAPPPKPKPKATAAALRRWVPPEPERRVRVAVSVEGLWQTAVMVHPSACWEDVRSLVGGVVGGCPYSVQLTPSGGDYEECRLNDGDELLCEHVGDTHLLHFASAEGNIAAIRSWVASGADVDMRDPFGRTPLMRAQEPDVLAELLRLGADVNARDKRGCTALFGAVSGYIVEANGWGMCVALLRAGADPNVRDVNGDTAVEHASVDLWTSGQERRADKVEWLLENFPDVGERKEEEEGGLSESDSGDSSGSPSSSMTSEGEW